MLQVSWGWVSNGKDSLRVVKVNSQPEIINDVKVWVSDPTSPSQPAAIKNFYYEAFSGQPFSTELVDRALYGGTKNSAVDGANHLPKYAIDNIVDHSTVEKNYRSKAGYNKPWIEVALTEPVVVAGLEVTTFGAEDNKRFRNVIIRAGLVQSPVGGASAGNNLLSHNNWMYKYVITADQGEVVYIMFKYPVTN